MSNHLANHMIDVGPKLSVLLAVLAACSSEPVGEGGSELGQARLQIESVPSDVFCLRVDAVGPSRSATALFDLAPGESSQDFSMHLLPLGSVSFEGSAFGVACTNVTDDSAPDWLSDRVTAPVLRGSVADVRLLLRRNGRVNVTADFDDGDLCLADAEPCGGASDCCSGSCVAGACASACTGTNVALNASATGFPNTDGSDQGWGGGSQPWEILMGSTSYTDTWAHGLAFTGGELAYAGETCGMRQATVDFGGQAQTFDRVVAWHHGSDHVPSSYHIEYWDGSAWVNAGGVGAHHPELADYPASGWGSEPTENVFPSVTATKVRFVIDSNCDITHGWLYALQVFSSCE